jgi:hypothetical protein
MTLRKGALALAAALALLAGCKSAELTPNGPDAFRRHLELSALPAGPTALPSGTIVTVTARVVPEAEMAWVSGTVKLMGAPVLGMKPELNGKGWYFRTMIPPLVTIPPGHYEVKAWGKTKAGEAVNGLMSYEVQ